MKRFVSFVVLGCFVFALAGCGGGGSKSEVPRTEAPQTAVKKVEAPKHPDSEEQLVAEDWMLVVESVEDECDDARLEGKGKPALDYYYVKRTDVIKAKGRDESVLYPYLGYIYWGYRHESGSEVKEEAIPETGPKSRTLFGWNRGLFRWELLGGHPDPKLASVLNHFKRGGNRRNSESK